MSLQNWLDNGWLSEHRPTRQEIADLLAIADRDLRESRTAGLSTDWKFNIAYNALLQAATAALAAAGYRAGRDAHHYRTLQSLAFTVGASTDLLRQVDAFRKKRNLAGYERIGAVSDQEVVELQAAAASVRRMVEDWIRANHPELL